MAGAAAVRAPRRRRVVMLVAALGVGPLVACGTDTGDPTGGEAATPGSVAPGDVRALPPNDPAALARIYDPMLEPMGLKLTRGALIDRSDGGYDISDAGTHLALYVEPTGERTDEEFLAGVWDVAAVVTPDVFARFTDVASYDICQEPLPLEDDRPEPPPVSQIDIDRATAESIDWEDGSLVDLIAASQRGELLLRVDESIVALRGWQEASAEAAAAPSSTGGHHGGS